MDAFSTQFLICFVCGTHLPKRTDKHDKPYFVCEPCGIQLFVRRKQGIDRLERLLRASVQNAIPLAKAGKRLFEVQALLSEIEGTKKQIRSLDDEIGIFFPDEDKVRARKALKTKLDGLLEELEKECEQKRD
jgi:hypothetical protein